MYYVQEFPQAPIKKDLWLKIPSGFQVEYVDNDYYALNLHRNIYGYKKTEKVCYKYLTKNLTKEIGFTKSDIDECVFYWGSFM